MHKSTSPQVSSCTAASPAIVWMALLPEQSALSKTNERNTHNRKLSAKITFVRRPQNYFEIATKASQKADKRMFGQQR